MRAIWKGAIAFGLVNVPVKVYAATEDHDVSLHQVHDRDGGRIRYQRRCEVCGKVVEYKDIAKAYDDGEQTVVLTDEDLASLPVEKSREIDVVEFVPSEQVDPILFDRTYYLEPDSKSTKSYVLLRRTLEETDRTAIVQFSLRQKTRLGALRVRGDVLVLQTLLWEDEVREAAFPSLDEKVRISAKELQMSSALVDSFSSDFDPAEFTDEYQEQLRTLIEAKLEKGETVSTEDTFGEDEEEEGGKVLDLMEALRRSVEKGRGKRGGAKDDARADSDDSDKEDAGGEQASKRKTTSRSRSTSAASGGSGRKSSGTGSSGKTSAAKSSGTKSSGTRSSAKSRSSSASGGKTADKSSDNSKSTRSGSTRTRKGA